MIHFILAKKPAHLALSTTDESSTRGLTLARRLVNVSNIVLAMKRVHVTRKLLKIDKSLTAARYLMDAFDLILAKERVQRWRFGKLTGNSTLLFFRQYPMTSYL